MFDGDKKKNPKCFRQYVLKVDSYVEIAKNIIDDSEIGLRLHAALEGDAADYLEDIPARTFGAQEGWKVLLRVLKEKFDERRMHKVGSAMKGFFRLDVAGKNLNMVEVADSMDKAARRCKEAGLTIPDEVMVYFFFEHTSSSTERQANILLRTKGEYNWKLVKQAVELLYPTVQVRSGRDPGRDFRDRGGKPRSAHEARQWDDEWRLPDATATEEQILNWLADFDPAEALVEQDLDNLPEDLAKNLHSCLATHRENRQRLAKAVQARGFYVNSGKGKKGSKGSGGKAGGKGKGKTGKSSGKPSGHKARGGMSLDELKAVTVCGDCGQRGHWRGDAGCPKKVNEATRVDDGDDDPAPGDEDEQWQDDWYGYGDDDWEAERYGYPVTRSAQAATRTTTTRSPTATSPTSRPLSSATSYRDTAAAKNDLEHEAGKVARGINKVRGKVSKEPEVPVSEVAEALKTDDFFASALTRQIKEAHRPSSSRSSAPEAVEKAYQHFGLQLVSRDNDLRDFLRDDGATEAFDIDKLRRAFPVRCVGWDLGGPPRTVMANRRAPSEVDAGKDYLTIDTACENTVVGKRLLDRLLKKWLDGYGLKPRVGPEREFYCFGPGEPKESTLRYHIPVGIAGKPVVISTSVIDDTETSEIPFLAGQDFLTLLGSVIDMGRREVIFPTLGDAKARHSGIVLGIWCLSSTIFLPAVGRKDWPHPPVITLERFSKTLFIAMRCMGSSSDPPQTAKTTRT